MRYTTSKPIGRTVREDDVPLLAYHLRRLTEAHQYFSAEYPSAWVNSSSGEPSEADIWITVRQELEKAKEGDWRVRVVLHPRKEDMIEVQVVPAPAGIAPFRLMPEPERPEKRRPLILDSTSYDDLQETRSEKEKRLYKTTDRRIYDEASQRGSALYPEIDHPEILIHTSTHLLESVTSNIAIQMPHSDHPGGPGGLHGKFRWVTPKLDREDLPFLDGVMRRYLLNQGVIEEGGITMDDWEMAKKDGRRVIGFNGLRGVWEAEPL